MIPTNLKIEDSYLKHIDNERNNRITNKIPSNYTDPDSIDAWRHKRMRDRILPLINFYPKTRWITLGDGCFASDAHYLENKGLDVLATSISDETISAANKLGYIKKYKKMNAENIMEEDNSFDFVFCKEAYHHFPRPYIALYEMLRVASKGVVLIEPQKDKNRILDYLKKVIKELLKKDINFEETGNFIFRINIKEFEKVMTAMNLNYIAYKKFNDFFIASLSTKSIKGLNKAKIITFLGVVIQNLLCHLKLMDYGLAVVVLFKNDVDDELLKILNNKNFHIKKLPINPYA